MIGLRLIENLILPFVKNPFDLLSMAHTCSGIRKYVCNMKYWKCSRNPYCNGDCGFDVFIIALRFLSNLESEDSLNESNCISYLIRFSIYPYHGNDGFKCGEKKQYQFEDMLFPRITWFYPITEFTYILYDDWAYHNVGEQTYGIEIITIDLIMKRICLYYSGDGGYEYNNTIQCNWIRKHFSGSETYTMIPDKIYRKK
jgi:hypothetical protein